MTRAPRRSGSHADRAAITPETLRFGAARRKHSLAGGIWGWYDHDIAETKPWGFDVHRISRPVAVWHGGQDRFRPPRARGVAGREPSARDASPAPGRSPLLDPRDPVRRPRRRGAGLKGPQVWRR